MPCAAVGLWGGAMLVVPFGAVTALLILVSDHHTWQLSNALPSALAAVASTALLLGSARVTVHFRALNAAARQRRRRHEMLIDLFATDRPDLGKVNVIATERLFAYSVPCIIYGRIVLSQGTLDLLDTAPLHAVLAHERAHLLARHHLVLQLAMAMGQAFPRWSAATALAARITDLIEMSADCYARRHVSRQAAITALVALADMAVPAEGLPAGGRAVALRLSHLRAQPHCCQTARSAGVYAVAMALLVLAPAVGYLNRIIDLCPWGAT